jgi:NifU-like protein involved in Fe-S cluster formation
VNMTACSLSLSSAEMRDRKVKGKSEDAVATRSYKVQYIPGRHDAVKLN